MFRLALAAFTFLALAGCDATGLGGAPTFEFDLEEGVEKTLSGDGYAEIRCSFAGCTERFVFEDGGEALYITTASPSSSPSLSAVDRTIIVGRSNGTRASMELDGFGVSLDVGGELSVECAGDRVRGTVEFVASFNNRPGELVEVTGDFDVPRTTGESWTAPLPPCR